jgi:hypothetical protein
MKTEVFIYTDKITIEEVMLILEYIYQDTITLN